MRLGSHIRHHGEESAFVYRLLDISLICLVLITTALIHDGQFVYSYEIIMSSFALIYFVIAELSGIYRTYRYSSVRQLGVSVISTWLICTIISVNVGLYFNWIIIDTYQVITIWCLLTPIVLVFWRWCFVHLPAAFLPKDSYHNKSIIIGATRSGFFLANELLSNDQFDEEIVGFYDDRTTDRISTYNLPLKIRGNIDDALLLAKNVEIKNVYIALPMEASKRIRQILDTFADSNAHVHLVPDFFNFDLLQSRWKNIGKAVTVSVYDTPFYGFTSFLKRIEDVVVGSVILLLISPVLLVVALGVKLSSPGPVIFKQKRYGLDGRAIEVWKFRSMTTQDNGSVVKQATKNDPRITPFGRFIRRTSLDELPQFFNVLSGTMSIVGPRPHAVAHNEEYRGLINKYMLRHQVKPGITGWAQINGYRGETDTLEKMENRVKYDLIYIQSWSLWLDIKIIFLTIFKGFVSKTAY